MLCVGVAFYAVFVDNLYMFLNVAIAGNLLCLVFFGWTPRKRHTLLYLLGSVGGSLVIVLVPLMMGALGRNEHGICYLAKQVTPSEKQLYFVFLVYFPVIPSAMFCFLAPLLTNIYMHFGRIPQSVYFPNLGSTVKSLVRRVSIYPLTSIFCIGGYALIIVQLGLYNEASIGATYWSLVGLRSTGLINFLAFLMDPAFSDLIAVVFKTPRSNPLLKPSKRPHHIQIPDDDCHYQAPPSSPNPEHVVKPFHQTIPPDYAHMNAEFSKLMAYLDLY
ncbi:hypothetical protein DSO57_1017658 [Entomophthora muscae]|nr:hypothetical protein DSO57_1020163 [Entomophthora muscae]KAJ9077341.1 hypothetical protein DSO57_1017658 [Entomophthora muscae]